VIILNDSNNYSQTELELIRIWEDILCGGEFPWALFQFGTCVLLRNPAKNLEQQAINLMSTWGLPISGTPSFKSGVSYLSEKGIPGCIVSCHHPDIMTFVSPEETKLKTKKLPDFTGVRIAVANLGRKKRQWDYETQKIIHIHEPKTKHK